MRAFDGSDPGALTTIPIAATVFGTFNGSLTPQSAALLMMIRSAPYCFTRATMRSSSILVFG